MEIMINGAFLILHGCAKFYWRRQKQKLKRTSVSALAMNPSEEKSAF